jgi:hypothetical protein
MDARGNFEPRNRYAFLMGNIAVRACVRVYKCMVVRACVRERACACVCVRRLHVHACATKLFLMRESIIERAYIKCRIESDIA